MPGLVPGIHVLSVARAWKNVDGRDKPGHDEGESSGTSGAKTRFALCGHDDAETGRDSRDHLSPIARIRKSPARGRALGSIKE
jgi:hypothetical protein